MSEKLKPCPWCQNTKDLYVAEREHTYFIVECVYCDIEGPPAVTQEKAIEYWNTRTRPHDTGDPGGEG